MIDTENTAIDTMKVGDEPKSAARILAAIHKAEDYYNNWQAICDNIDSVYAKADDDTFMWDDVDYDLFWSSTEILKQSIYARPPKPVVAPMFSDRRKLYVTTADVLERSISSAYEHGGIDEALLGVRDDLIFYNRGQIWLNYDSTDGQRICIDHLDRKDFIHPPARKWSEVPWVDRVCWLTRSQWDDRFPKQKDLFNSATKTCADGDNSVMTEGRARAHEVWHKHDKRVYWVADGVDVILDQRPPHYDLEGFFPCPRPAYGTLKPRTLLPRPDYIRYASHFRKINKLTRRIYTLLDACRVMGLIAAGGDVNSAVEQIMAENDHTAAAITLVPVNGAGLAQGGKLVEFLPLDQIVAVITGSIEARRELFSDYDRLSGISDIMRGETEASETLGAQRLKGQYGSVRVRGKTDEIVRLSRDVTRIAAEMMAEHFTSKTLMDMSQLEIPTDSEIKKEISGIEDAAEAEMRQLGQRAQEEAQAAQAQSQEQGQPVPPEAMQHAAQQFQQAQQQIIAKYAPQIKAAGDRVSIEAVMKLLRDNRARNFAFEIETDSTILTDEAQAKQASTEFYTAFTGGMQGLAGAAAMGEEAIRAATEVLKYTLSPYRPPRAVIAAIDEFLDAAPEVAQRMQEQGEGDADQGAEALAAAEMEKAKAQMAKVQADSQLKQAELQQRMAQMQAEFQEKQARMQIDAQKLELQASKQEQEFAAKMADMDAKQNLMQAQTAEILAKIGLDVRKQDLEEYRAQEETQARQVDQAMRAEGEAFNQAQAIRQDQRADRGEDRADRKQDFSEGQPQ